MSDEQKPIQPLPAPPNGYRNPPPPGGPMRGFFMAVGVLIMGLTGLCSGSMIVGSLGDKTFFSTAAIALIVGGIPFVVGLIIYLAAKPKKR